MKTVDQIRWGQNTQKLKRGEKAESTTEKY